MQQANNDACLDITCMCLSVCGFLHLYVVPHSSSPFFWGF